ncbi:hypothetical protein ACTJLC_29995 [Paraburkholderia sp. 22099]|jgi:hypothetical protein|uniref:hypothetical protein n=1 Tax=Paraburkholderia TaxID=1822464 RepID=UPI00285D5C3A|nr:hypothetical protein [Paraburkholderia terricola]
MKTALIAPRPLDVLELPADLDGRDGTNRAHGPSQIAARDDLNAVRAWLARVADKKTTFENYRKEAERPLLCAIVQLGKPLSSLTHEDPLMFRQFIKDPQPRTRWVADDGRKYPRARTRAGVRSTGRSAQADPLAVQSLLCDRRRLRTPPALLASTAQLPTASLCPQRCASVWPLSPKRSLRLTAASSRR